MSLLLALCVVLTACGSTQPVEEPAALPSTKAQALTTPQLSPVLPVAPAANGNQQMFAVAQGNGLYLVVWMEAGTHDPDILGVRVRASDGVVLDSSPLLIATGSNVQLRPAVAFDGANFLVVWEEYVPAPAIYGTRVRASDGAVLDTPATFLSRVPTPPGPFAQTEPAVAFDGRNYLVTWQGGFVVNNQSWWGGILGIRVQASDGTVIDSSAIRIGASGSYSRVAYSAPSGNYLVVWEKSGNVEAARVSASSGQVVDTTPLSVAATAGNERSAAVAARDGEFFVVWRGGDNGLWGRRLRASDGARLGSADTFVGPDSVSPPEVTFDGAEYWIGWQGTRGGVLQELVTRVTPEGGVEPEAELALKELPAGTPAQRGGIASVGSGLVLAVQMSGDVSHATGWMRLVTTGQVHISREFAPASLQFLVDANNQFAAASGNGITFVVWSGFFGWPPQYPEILGLRVRTSDGVPLDPAPVRVSSGAFGLRPSVAFDGTQFLVTWMTGIPTISAARVRASDGAVLDSTPINLDRSPFAGHNVAGSNSSVTFDGTNFLVVWGGGAGYYRPDQYNGIMGIHVRPDGTVVEPTVFEVAHFGIDINHGWAYLPQASSTDGIALVTWVQEDVLKAVRLNGSTGQILDTTPITLGETTGTAGNERNPAVAAREGEFLVAWSARDGGVWSRRLRASDGRQMDPTDTFVGPGAVAAPAAAFDGTNYRISWPANRGGATQLVTTRLLSTNVADTELVVSPMPTTSVGSSEQRQVFLIPSGPGSFLVTYLQRSEAWGYGIGARIVSGDLSPDCVSLEPSLVLNGAAQLTLECGSGPYSDPGAQVFDGCGSPIAVHAYNSGQDSSGPGPNASLEGTYSVSYVAWDTNGHTVSATRTVIVDDRTAPTLTLNGAAHMTHTCGSQWGDPGVQATDACYGNLTPQVWHSGEVNGWAEGTYTVTYSLTDSGGNSATPVTRTVDVVDCPW